MSLKMVVALAAFSAFMVFLFASLGVILSELPAIREAIFNFFDSKKTHSESLLGKGYQEVF